MRNRLIPFCAVLGLALVACGGDGDGASPTTTSTTLAPITTPAPTTTPDTPATTTTVPLVTEGATVIVANGNIVGGSAGRMSDALAVAGFTVATPANGTEKVDASVVYYTEAAGAQAVAESVATALGGVDAEPLPDPIPTETGTLDGGDVLLYLGNNEADKPLAGLQAGDPDTPASTSGLTIVVANANAVGGSAGRMSAQLEAAGFTVGTPTDGSTTATDSIVYYSDAAGAQEQADALAEALGGIDVLPLPDPIPTESGTLDGDILLLLGSAQADKPLAELTS